MWEDEIGKAIVHLAVQIHAELGSGLLESVYEVVLAKELERQGFSVERQVAIPISYRGLTFVEGFRVDILVERKVIIELKSIERANNSHRKQLLTYLRLANIRLGYLLNFGQPLMRDGMSRIVNGLAETPGSEPSS